MKRMLLRILCVALFFSLYPLHLYADGGPERTDQYRIVSLFPGGDVLRPGSPSSGYKWYLGFDVGLTYSMFQDGPLYFYQNVPTMPLFDKTVVATVDEGSGLGYYIGAAADFPVSSVVGIVVKANYHTRTASFDQDTKVDSIFIAENNDYYTVWFNDEVDWEFSYFGLDLLARIQLMKESLYLLVGPSFNFLLANNAEVTQKITNPPDVYFRDEDGTTTNQVLSRSSDGEVEGFESFRADLKFGIGTWIELSKGLYLTPELTMNYPLTQMVKESYATSTPLMIDDGSSAISQKVINANPRFVTYKNSNQDFNMITFFLTVGLRWQID